MRRRLLPYIAAIVPAAGSGLRLLSKVPKPLVAISGVPIFIRAVSALSKNAYIKEIILLGNPSNIALIKSALKRYRIKKIKGVFLGGSTRRLSVENGLRALSDKSDYVLIHDAVRPFVSEALLKCVIESALECGAAAAGVPVKATIKKVGNYRWPVSHKNITVVKSTVPRDNLREIQTPQVFRKDIILKAYSRCKDRFVSDDAMLVERLGVRVSVAAGSYYNIKITTPEDLILAEAIWRAKLA